MWSNVDSFNKKAEKILKDFKEEVYINFEFITELGTQFETIKNVALLDEEKTVNIEH